MNGYQIDDIRTIKYISAPVDTFYYTQTVILFPGVGFQEVDRLLNDMKQSVCVCVCEIWDSEMQRVCLGR